jgi:tetratricopeptide (TPR) repeat protein
MAESPSELQDEIEKLERKHAENPEGRYFVPLANDYRKMGDLGRAESLLREGLEKHPDYLSARIVLGRCLADKGSNAEAAEQFDFVLSMDPQNLIALRSLAEIALADDRADDAERWYRELLAVDPMNDDARAALERVAAEPREAAPTPGEEGSWWDPESEEPVPPHTPAARQPASVEAAEPAEPDRAAEPAGSAGPAGNPEPPTGIAPRDLTDELDEWELPEEVESVEVVTETIAELYARQGLHDRAAGVYRELIRRRGGDPALESRLEELERAAAAESTTSEDWHAEEPGLAPAASRSSSDDAPPDVEFGPRREPRERDDAFATSFAFGFDDAAEAAEGERAPAPAAPPEPDPEPEPQPVGSAGPGSSGETIATYLAALAAWTPGAEQPGEPLRETAGEPWASRASSLPAAATGDLMLPEQEAGELSLPVEPVDEPAGDLSLRMDSPAQGPGDLSLRSDSPEQSEGEPSREPSIGTLPVEGAADDLTMPAEPANEPAGDSEPVIELEDYFPESAEQAPEPAAPPAADEDDDDLESFQAWLRSLKR